ncbi:MAG: site-2 protease family protein [candidate division SR1 bacterium]|nr:MAG: site-2 protease family protein [candidate division SR1 bacterium]
MLWSGASLIELIQLGIILIISIAIHEFAHAWVSYKLGDPTPKLQKRVTLNPLAHIDPLGLVMVFLIGFGRGKPVEINPGYYKNQRIGEFKVAMAGPLSNLLLATIGIIILLFISKFSGMGINTIFSHAYTIPLAQFLGQFAYLNIILMVFNLLPIPPLDGFTLVKLVNIDIAEKILKYQKYIFIGFLIFVFSPLSGNFLSTIAKVIFNVLTTILASVIYLI